jgi:hypothetical protein
MIVVPSNKGTIASSIPFSARYVSPGNIVAFWNMDNDPQDDQIDSSGNDITLVYQEAGGDGPYASLVPGKVQDAVSFNAPDLPGDMSEGGRYYTESFGVDVENDFTMSVWMRTRNFSSYSHVIGAPFQNGLYVGGNDTNQTFSLFNGTVFGLTAPAVAANTWVHYVFIREGSELVLYVNGSLSGSIDITGETFNNGTFFSVGGGEYNEYFYDGDIDALGLWNISLPFNEISALYNNGRGAQFS